MPPTTACMKAKEHATAHSQKNPPKKHKKKKKVGSQIVAQ
jgi:hypothetical protein